MNRLIGLFRKKVASSLLLLVGAAAGGLAQADTTYTYTYDYNFTVNNGCVGAWHASCGLTGTQIGNSANPTPAPADPNAPPNSIGATATGWANTQGNQSTTSNQTLEKGHITAWTSTGSGSSRVGMGVRNLDYSTSANGGESLLDGGEGSSPEHAVDNNDRYDSILYSFDQVVSLTQVSLSWYTNDSDITILAFTGDTYSEASNLAGLRYDELLLKGWSRIGHYDNIGYQTSVNTAISSSYWLIGAANPLVGGTVKDTIKDYIKIAALSGKITTEYTQKDNPPSGVPEPGSLALLGLGWLLLLRARAKS